jgi:hypothetical protein
MQAREKPGVSNLENVTKALQNLISLVLGLIAFLSAGGFIVVNSHLARFTDIHGYNISPRQYVAAGVGLLFPPLLALAVVFVAYYAGRLLGILTLNPRFNSTFKGNLSNNMVAQKIAPSVHYFDSLVSNPTVRRLMFAVGIGFYILVFGNFYGAYIYGTIPYYLGGGRPETILLVFKEPATATMLGFSTDGQINNRTRTMLMLAQLENGWLVADTTTGQVAAVSQDVLIGVMDDVIQPLVITPVSTTNSTATPSFTSTP